MSDKRCGVRFPLPLRLQEGAHPPTRPRSAPRHYFSALKGVQPHNSGTYLRVGASSVDKLAGFQRFHGPTATACGDGRGDHVPVEPRPTSKDRRHFDEASAGS